MFFVFLRRYSGLQRQVLTLYRDFIREVNRKVHNPKCTLTADDRQECTALIRSKFEQVSLNGFGSSFSSLFRGKKIL